MDKGRRNKHIIVADVSVHGEGSQPPVRNQLIFLREKYAERSETEKYVCFLMKRNSKYIHLGLFAS